MLRGLSGRSDNMEGQMDVRTKQAREQTSWRKLKTGQVVVHTFSSEAEAGGALWVQGQLGGQSEFQDHQDYTQTTTTERKKKKFRMPLMVLLIN